MIIGNIKTWAKDPRNTGQATVYCGRPKHGTPWRWGNPFSIGDPHPETGKPMSRDDVCEWFDLNLRENKDDARFQWMRNNIEELEGKVWLCFCHPLRCHCESFGWLIEPATRIQLAGIGLVKEAKRLLDDWQ